MSKFPTANLLVVSALAAALLAAGPHSDLFLGVLAVGVVLLIVFGEHSRFEQVIESRGWPGREAIAPLAALALALALGALDVDRALSTVADKLDIVVLILSFAIVSYGLGRSGFFEFAAHYFVARAKGVTAALVINMYILSSILTYVTSNDIVVLVLTPIIFSICVNAGIANAKLILLSQFVAANTVSMGLLIGSPTNIIVSDTLNISFFEYFLLMLVPSLASFATSLIVADLINRSVSGGKALGALNWGFQPEYAPDRDRLTPYFTPTMARWLGLFGLVVIAVAVVTQLALPLYWCALPTFAVALALVAFEPNRPLQRSTTEEVLLSLQRLPYSIIAFGLVFFIFAAELAARPFGAEVLVPLLRQVATADPLVNQVATIFGTGLMVNLFNDLPASALWAGLYAEAGLQGPDALASVQAALIGLNIGCYVTPIGALAGIIWFNILKSEAARQAELAEQAGLPPPNIVLPTRIDLVTYGAIHFVVTALVCALISSATLQIALHMSERGPTLAAIFVAGAVTVFLFAAARVILRPPQTSPGRLESGANPLD